MGEPVYIVSVDELQALACAVALDEDIEVVVGAPGSGWFINSESGVINADEADLLGTTAEDIRGLICHEAAHAAVTRYPRLMPEEALRAPGIASLMNSLEDCRIEDWICTRYPGARPWVRCYNNRLFPKDGEGLQRQPWFQQFCLGAIHEWWYGEPPDNLHPRPLAALEKTRVARQAVVDAQPPVSGVVDLLQALAYDRSPVAARFAIRDQYSPPDAFERLVRVTAFEAYRQTWNRVRPVYEELIEADRASRDKMKDLERDFLRTLRDVREGAPVRSGRRRPSDGDAGPEGVPAPGADDDAAPAPTTPERLPDLDPELRHAVERAVDPDEVTAWDGARRAVSRYADKLVDELDRVLRPASYPRWLPGYPSGSRVDLRVAMTVEVQPGAYAAMWERKTLPHKRDPAFLLLLDLSGSMTGAPIEHGFRGVVLVAEVLDRLGVPFAVYGFQDVALPFKQFADPMDPETRRRMGGMPDEVRGEHRGGHNRPQHNWDGPVLRQAAQVLLEQPASQRFLLVVSDGEPSGPEDAEGALHRAVSEVVGADIHLLGIGLGPGTEHVRRFYPDHLANIPLEQFPVALGRIVDEMLVGRGPRATRTR